MSMLARLLVSVAVPLLLAGCGGLLDADHVRLCRQTIPAVDSSGGPVVVTRVEPAGAPFEIAIAYRATIDGQPVTRYVWCGFAADERLEPRRLAAFANEEGRYSPIRLYILNRYWLQKQELSVPADPGPGESSRPGLTVSARLAYFVQALINALPATGMVMLIAVAYALIYGLVGRINLAFGQIAMIGGGGAVFGATLAASVGGVGVALSAAMLAALAAAILVGRASDRLVFGPLAFGPSRAVLVATLALGIVIQEGLRLTQPPTLRWMPPVLSNPVPIATADGFAATLTPMQLLVALVAGGLALMLTALMRWSEFGRQWRAVADDPLMAEMMGLSRRAILSTSFLLASAMAGVAGFIMSAHYGGTGFAEATMLGLKGLVAAVLGGIGSIGGALLGGLVVGLFEAAWSAYLPIEQRDLAVLLLLVLALVLRPGGLFGIEDDRPPSRDGF